MIVRLNPKGIDRELGMGIAFINQNTLNSGRSQGKA
jgi:hypothetical protein